MADGMHGHETVSSNAVTIEFDNDDGIDVGMSNLGDGATNPRTGELWYGGPGVEVSFTATPVLYSGDTATSVTLLAICGSDAVVDDEAPYEFEPDCDDSTGREGVTPKFSVVSGGQSHELGPLNAEAFPIRLDFKGPDAPHFSPNPNGRQDGWVNAAVDFLGKQSSRNRDGWLTYNHDDDATGVGGYMPQLRFSSTTPSLVDGARAATANAIPTAPTKGDAVCVIATAVDLLGNESKLPSAGKACVNATGYEEKLDALKEARDADDPDADAIADALAAIPAGLRGGLDVSAPTIAFTGVSPTNNDRDLQREFQVQVTDTGASSTGKSGLHDDPVLAKVVIRNVKDEMLCGNDDDDGLPGDEKITGECVLHAENGLSVAADKALVTTTGVAAASTVGYYTFTAVARDKAGNRSEEISRVALEDTSPPGAGLIVGTFDAKKSSYSVTVTATDNLSVRDHYLAMVFPATDGLEGTAPELRLSKTAVDAYNDALTKTTSFSGSINAVRALQATTAAGDAGDDDYADLNTVSGTVTQITSIDVSVRDQSSNPGTAGTDSEDDVAAATDITGLANTQAGDAQTTTHFEAFVDEDDLDIDDVVELEVLVVGDGVAAVDAVLGDNPDTAETETDFVVTQLYRLSHMRIRSYAWTSMHSLVMVIPRMTTGSSVRGRPTRPASGIRTTGTIQWIVAPTSTRQRSVQPTYTLLRTTMAGGITVVLLQLQLPLRLA